jgi:hypothetical protein
MFENHELSSFNYNSSTIISPKVLASHAPVPVVFQICTKFRQIAMARFGDFTIFEDYIDLSADVLFLQVNPIVEINDYFSLGFQMHRWLGYSTVSSALKYILEEGPVPWTNEWHHTCWLSSQYPSVEQFQLINGLTSEDRGSLTLSQLTDHNEP